MTTKIKKVTDFPNAVTNDQLRQQAQLDAQNEEFGVEDVIEKNSRSRRSSAANNCP